MHAEQFFAVLIAIERSLMQYRRIANLLIPFRVVMLMESARCRLARNKRAPAFHQATTRPCCAFVREYQMQG